MGMDINDITIKAKQEYLFNSPFEERKVLGYIYNLIKSKYLRRCPSELLLITCELLGDQPVIEAICRVYPEFQQTTAFAAWQSSDYFRSTLSPQQTCAVLEQELSKILYDRIAALASTPETTLERRFNTIRQLFKLSDGEAEMLLFQYYLQNVRSLEHYMGSEHMAGINFTLVRRIMAFGHMLFGREHGAFNRDISRGLLLKTQHFFERNGDSLSLFPWCQDYLLGLGDDDISMEFFSSQNDEILTPEDFDMSAAETAVLDVLLTGDARANILLYGAPGAGKTSFVRALAKKYGRRLLSVKTPESGEHKDRLRALQATVNLADPARALVLVDEADEILNTASSSIFSGVTQKSWINNFLDEHAKKVIWIANRTSDMDQSTMRRFSFSLEFGKVDQAKRVKVLKYELEKSGIAPEAVGDDVLRDLCLAHAVDAGGIANAVRTAAPALSRSKGEALEQIRVILKNHERATGGSGRRDRARGNYSLEGLNASADLSGIVAGLQRFVRDEHRTDRKTASLLLYGPPGTGKTEFVNYLGQTLNKEVLLKRASEIQDKWIGATEKNIASAFAQAERTDNILFFDEADSFLFPRAAALRSYEISFTNEILTQLENFSGVVIFATNDIDGLDPAALRRFRFKVRFDTLTPEGALSFYRLLLAPLARDGRALSDDETARLKRTSILTPGDYAVVRDRAAFAGDEIITHDWLITALLQETRHKRALRNTIGF